MYKLLFLDIDGVLITNRSKPAFDVSAINQLKILLNSDPNLMIVISSARRKFVNKPKLENFRLMFSNVLEEKYVNRIYDVLPSLWFASKGTEIMAYIKNLRAPHLDYVIFDDNIDSIIKFSEIKYETIYINPEHGISAFNVSKALQILNR